MYLREAPTETLTMLIDKLDVSVENRIISGNQISVDLTRSNTISVGTLEMPVTTESLDSVRNYLGIPSSFAERLGNTGIAERLMNDLLALRSEPISMRHTDDTIVSLREPGSKTIESRRLVEVAARVISPDALVLDFESTIDNFSFGCIAPANLERAIGGDRPTKNSRAVQVGDMSVGGLRFGQNLKTNTSPWTAPFIYRYVCTNGMLVPDTTLKVEGRGNTVDDVIFELEAAAQRAFGRLERDMEHFYAMRDIPVENPERMINRLAAENGLSDRLRLQLIEAVPTVLGEGATGASMFDLVNMVTNQANDPTIRRVGTRRELQSFGGAILGQHVERCRSCSSRLN